MAHSAGNSNDSVLEDIWDELEVEDGPQISTTGSTQQTNVNVLANNNKTDDLNVVISTNAEENVNNEANDNVTIEQYNDMEDIQCEHLCAASQCYICYHIMVDIVCIIIRMEAYLQFNFSSTCKDRNLCNTSLQR